MSTDTVNNVIELSMVGLMIFGAASVLVNRWMVINAGGRRPGFTMRSIQYLGVSFVFPVIVLLAVSGEMDKTTVGTLIGTVVGYILSGLSERDDAQEPARPKPLEI